MTELPTEPSSIHQVIYEDLCSFKSKSSSLLLQQQLNFQPKEKRDWVIKELIETEGSYVDVLNMLRKHFIRPISTMKVAFSNTSLLPKQWCTVQPQCRPSKG